jgi:hypothetical protein
MDSAGKIGFDIPLITLQAFPGQLLQNIIHDF